MKRINLIYSSIFAFATVSAFAQINQTPIHSNGNQIYTTGDKKMDTQGSMFIEDKFLPAKVTGTDAAVLVRYNAYLDQFEASNPQEQSQKVLAKQPGVNITFANTGESYTYESYKTEKDEAINGYLNVISDGAKVKIYRSKRVYLQQGKQSRNSYQEAQAPSYKRANDEFYVKMGNAAEAKYFDGKKDFAKLVPGKEKEVLDYIKKNKLDLEKDTDLQKLGSYVETLI